MLKLRNALLITEATVKTHVNNIFEKLQLRDRVELALYALRHGLVATQDRGRGSDRRLGEKMQRLVAATIETAIQAITVSEP